MASRQHPDGNRPQPPPPQGKSRRPRDLAPAPRVPRDRNEALKETEAHAKEVRATLRGRDGKLEWHEVREKPPATFTQTDLLVVRNWLRRRPLESTWTAAALVRFPRLWTTKRGRYCRFQAPGAGVYGILRARPTF